MLLEPKAGIIYGPVRSRRLGRSLGINILPAKTKACPFDCVYCQYGWTACYTSTIPPDIPLPDGNAVKQALEKTLIGMKEPPAYITFSGNGEPTLHPDFDGMVDVVNAIRNRFTPSAKTAILSNSALVTEKSLRRSLMKLDRRIMKLDCGSPEVFRRYNQPYSGIDLEKVTQGLAELEDVIIQALFSAGETGNLDMSNIESWIERLKRINPKAVQLYTLDRDFPDKKLKPATKKGLFRIKKSVKKIGLSAEIF
ncbi:MAG: radical SAM protein [Candidatus Aminicenantes bacterium]|nr:MAG: radical SAM protein [Candidatus Aminicenantes bacterium]